MTFREAVKLLESAGVDAARNDAVRIFERFVGVDSSKLPLVMNDEFDSSELVEAIGKRCKHIPLQYILGTWEFFGLDFMVSPDCLCPRPDTETVVETALAILPEDSEFLELCTGSGCISVALVKNRSDLSGVATDKFENTLSVAKKNVEKHMVSERLTLVSADLFDEPTYIGERRFDAVISNPPYIPSGEIDALSDEVKREPMAALDGGEDGLDFYRHIVSKYTKYLKNNGVFIFEIGCDQASALENIAQKNRMSCKIIKDLGKNDRVAVISRESNL